MLELQSPRDTAGWKQRRVGEVEIFTTPLGLEYTRCSGVETPDAAVTFTRTLGLPSMNLRLVSESRVIRRIARRERKAARELAKRGY